MGESFLGTIVSLCSNNLSDSMSSSLEPCTTSPSNSSEFLYQNYINQTNVLNDSTTASGNETSNNLFYFYNVEQLSFLGVLLFMIVLGNSSVLATLLLTKTPRKSRMNFFIMHLALADLAVGLINVFTDFTWKITIAWYAGNIACKIVKYFQTVVLYSSNYVLVALSIDRYDAITHPLKFSGSWRRARMLIAGAWIFSLIFAIPPILIFHVEVLPHQGALIPQCWAKLEQYHWQIYISIVFVVLFMIPALVIAVCYTIMVHTIWTQSRILTPKAKGARNPTVKGGIFRKSTCKRDEILTNNVQPDDDSRRASSRGLIPKAKIKSVKMTFVIVFVFILCSSPYFVFSLLQAYNFISLSTQSTIAMSTFFQSLSPLNSAANPIIYCLFSTHVTRNLRKIKFINWFALRFCPNFGTLSAPTVSERRRKFGGIYQSHYGGKSGRSDFSTSLTSLRSGKSLYSTSTTANRYNNHNSTKWNNHNIGSITNGNSPVVGRARGSQLSESLARKSSLSPNSPNSRITT